MFNAIIKSSLVAIGIWLIAACNITDQATSPADLPTEISSDFSSRHPESSNVEWEQEGNFWEAEFKENGVEVSVIYDLDFNWVRTEREIKINELPGSATVYLNENFPGDKIEEAESFESQDEGNGYIAEVKQQKLEIEVFFDESGNYLREVEEVDND